MATTDHKTGTVQSGDVKLFYRLFGEPGATPVIIIHGANYYDSGDWIDVAAALAEDRQVVAADTRGFGNSGWSASKDYSADASLADITALLDHLGWNKAVVMGHSMGGGKAILYGSRMPDRVASVIIVDHAPGTGHAMRGEQKINNKQRVFKSIDEVLETSSRDRDAPPGSKARARLESMVDKVEGGFVYRRDPDFGNLVPTTAGWEPKVLPGDMWDELKAIKAPLMIVRGTKSDRYDEAKLDRIRTEFPHIHLADVNSGHDVANGDPEGLIKAVKPFLRDHVDPASAQAAQ